MSTLFGASMQKSPTKENNYSYGVIAENNAVFESGDLVTGGSTGLELAPASTRILGVIAKSASYSATNQTVEKVEPAFTPIDQDYEFLMGTNADLNELTSPTKYYNIISTTIQYSGLTGTFQVGETITGGTSTATAVITYIDSVNGVLYLATVSGPFTNTETITGGTSGATATVDLYSAVTPGAQQVNVVAGTQTAGSAAAIVMCTKVDPNKVGGSGVGSGLRQGLFKIVSIQNYK